jgi:hypothetical protein
MGAFKPLNHIIFPSHYRPDFVDQGIQPPEWWKQTELMIAFDKIMGDKVSLGIHQILTCSTRSHR